MSTVGAVAAPSALASITDPFPANEFGRGLKTTAKFASVGNESLEVESSSSFKSMMSSPESSPSLFVQRLE